MKHIHQHHMSQLAPAKFTFMDGKKFCFDNMCGVNVRGTRTKVTIHPERGMSLFVSVVNAPDIPNMSIASPLADAEQVLRDFGVSIPFDFETMQVTQ
jgi:hypothetical protein